MEIVVSAVVKKKEGNKKNLTHTECPECPRHCARRAAIVNMRDEAFSNRLIVNI